MIQTEQVAQLVLGNPTYFDAKALRPYICGLRWPYVDDSIERATITHILEYLDGDHRIAFINELYRVMQLDTRATLYLPYWSSVNAYADPYLVWPPVTELSLQYLADAEFRERNHLDYPDIKANFRIAYGYSYAPEWHVRSDATRDFGVKHSLNVATQLVVTLTKL